MKKTLHKTLTKTEIQYGILLTGKKLGIPTDMDITVLWGMYDFPAHTHKTTAGRVDRLTAFIREFQFEVGDPVVITYDDADPNNLYVIRDEVANSESVEEEEEEELADTDWIEDEPVVIGEDKIKVTENGTSVADNTIPVLKERKDTEKVIKGELLGIPNPESWHDDPGICMPPHSVTRLYGSANNKYVVFISESNRFVIFNRLNCTVRVLDRSSLNWHTKQKEENIAVYGGMALTDSKYENKLYFADLCKIYEWNIEGDDIYDFASIPTSKYIEGLICFEADLFYTVFKEGSDSTWIYNRFGEERLIRKGGGVIRSISGNLLMLGNHGYGGWGKGSLIYDFDLGRSETIETYVKSLHPKMPEHLPNGCIYSINLAKRTVALRDSEKFTNSSCVPGSILHISAPGRATRVKGVKLCDNELQCRGYWFTDIYGHKVSADNQYGYNLAYLNPDGTSKSLFSTEGTGVPEGFQFVDSHTALIKVREGAYAICDFMQNKKFVIEA